MWISFLLRLVFLEVVEVVDWVRLGFYTYTAFKALSFVRMSSVQSVFGKREKRYRYGHMSDP